MSSVAYAVLLSQPYDYTMAPGKKTKAWTYYDYTYAMINRLTSLTSLPVLLMVTPEVGGDLRTALHDLSPSTVRVVEVPLVEVEGTSKENQRWRYTGSKLAPYNMTDYSQILTMDSDTFMLHNAGQVWDRLTSIHPHLGPRPAAHSYRTSHPTQPLDSVFCTLPPGANRGPGAFAAVTESKSGISSLYSSVYLTRPNTGTYNELLSRLQQHDPNGPEISDQVSET